MNDLKKREVSRLLCGLHAWTISLDSNNVVGIHTYLPLTGIVLIMMHTNSGLIYHQNKEVLYDTVFKSWLIFESRLRLNDFKHTCESSLPIYFTTARWEI